MLLFEEKNHLSLRGCGIVLETVLGYSLFQNPDKEYWKLEQVKMVQKLISSGLLKKPKIIAIIALVGSVVLLLQYNLSSLSTKWCKQGNIQGQHPLLKENDTEKHGEVEDGSLLLFVGVLNKVTDFKRRRAVRQTWMSLCKSFEKGIVECKFFTDSPDRLSSQDKEKVMNESEKYNDMLFMPYQGGYNFSLRLLWMMKWLTSNYKFDFFLRIDDDYFLCLERLVYELHHRQKNSLYWGYIHCRLNIVRVDEGWMILTRDLVEEALSKLNSSLPCHPYGDQAVAAWMIDSKFNVTYFYDNARIVHSATSYHNASYIGIDICRHYLALHGSYPKTMRKYWQVTQARRNTINQNITTVPDIPRYEDKCRFSNKVFDVQEFYIELRFEMKPCKDEPTWRITNSEFHSREIYGEV